MRRARYILVIALLVGACGDDGSEDREGADLERRLATTVERETKTREVTVNCPDEAGEGDVCDVSAPGGVRAKVTTDGKIVPP